MNGIIFIFYFLLALLLFSVLNIEIEGNLFLIFLFFIPLVIFFEPITYGLNKVLYKIYKNEYVGAFEVFQIAFSEFRRAWGIRLRVLQACWIHVVIITISSILLFKSIFDDLMSSLFYSSLSTTSYLLILILLITTIAFTIKLYYYKFTYLIAFNNPSINCKAIVLKSNRLMIGKRLLLFQLELPFIIINFIALLLTNKLTFIDSTLLDLAYSILTFITINQLTFSKIAFYEYYVGESSSNQIKENNNYDYHPGTLIEETQSEEHLSEADYNYLEPIKNEETLDSFDTFDTFDTNTNEE